MKYKKSIMTTFTILTLVGSNSLVSADQLKGLKPYEKIEFSKIDLDNDNLISKTELMNHRKENSLSLILIMMALYHQRN